MTTRVDSIINFFIKDRFLIGASILRLLFGSLILYYYLIHYSQRYFLWSSIGFNVIDDEFKNATYSLYNFSDSLLYFDVIFHLGIIFAFLYTIGYRGKVFSILNFIFYYSLYKRMMYIGDGGDNLMCVALFYLLFANSTAYFSVDASRKSTANPFVSILHNFSIILCIVQLCIVYFTSGFYQIMGSLWNNGTAIYYIAQVKTFSGPILKSFSDHFVYLSIIATYLSIFVKISFPFLLFNRISKIVIVTAIMLFHLGIAIGMGLITFSIVMISMEALLFTDDDYRKLYKGMSSRYFLLKERLVQRTARFGHQYLYKFKIVVFYDGWCPMCRQVKASCEKLDLFHLVDFVSFREPGAIDTYALDRAKLEVRMHSKKLNSSDVVDGIDSIIQLASRVVAYWPLLPLLLTSKYMGIGQACYDFIAKRRMIVSTNHCTDACMREPLNP
ncbi:DCC1-like thiol-disulfide oxidoreductase family protein [Paenibacillus sp. MZ04-78.2]|uniref:DCC1-like thiol-disulfide oxidoreductase family protein n=1 Tax=Paenibacillus sp. MZ04-78.2 TaxID=2962034 RepID=UPI0020B70D98|nr:DCC1-like thiol-disulfide oxidoreductase family protein [Paenibacillus sp. MZ04-78.2]MCP3774920.1 DCC1-like thiol-disulfide oxidoreductase family protein [Paenibacillus sp. MZ04-78.2]